MPQFSHLSTWYGGGEEGSLWGRRRGVPAPLRVLLPYLLNEVPWQMIPQALLSSRQLQTWMG